MKILFIDRDSRWEKITIGPEVTYIPHKQITEYDPNVAAAWNDLANAIFGQNTEEKWKDSYKEYLLNPEDCDLIILHASNRWAEKFFKHRCSEVPTILFSGGGVISDNFKEDEDKEAGDLFKNSEKRSICCFVDYKTLAKNLNDFLKELTESKKVNITRVPFDVLKHGSVGARVTKAHQLRYEILTPFIVLHLALQAHQENRAGNIWQMGEFGKLNEYREKYVSGSEQNDLLEFLSMLKPGDCINHDLNEESILSYYFQPFFLNGSPVGTVCGKLAEESQDFTLLEIMGCLNYIEVLAHNMEQVINYIEFRETPVWRSFS